MSLPLEFHPAVNDEVIDGFRFYERRQPGLGDEFVAEVRRVQAEIAANPARFGFAERDIREGLLARFPYAVYYRVRPDRIRVLAVYHTARDPGGWQTRA